jgi:hypothetical protein
MNNVVNKSFKRIKIQRNVMKIRNKYPIVFYNNILLWKIESKNKKHHSTKLSNDVSISKRSENYEHGEKWLKWLKRLRKITCNNIDSVLQIHYNEKEDSCFSSVFST